MTLCVICYRFDSSNDGISTSQVKSSLGNQTSIVFFLRKIFNFPKAILSDLVSNKGNPKDWIQSCSDCAKLIEDAQVSYESLVCLEKNFKSLKAKIKEKFNVSVQLNKSDLENYSVESSSKKEWIDEIRRFILKGATDCGELLPGNQQTQGDLQVQCLPGNVEVKIETEDTKVEFQECDPLFSFNEDNASSTSFQSVTSENSLAEQLFHSGRSELMKEFPNKKEESNNYAKAERFLERKKLTHCKEKKNGNRKPSKTIRSLKFNCDICHKAFKHSVTLKYHFKKFHSKELPYVCPTCDKGFTKEESLIKHEKKSHSKLQDAEDSSKERIYCEPCRRHYNSSLYDEHVRFFHLKDFSCKLCSNVYKDRGSLKAHERGKHSKELELKLYECTICGKILKHAKSFRLHSKVMHSTDLDYECRICSTKFLNEKRLEQHVKAVHDKEKSFQCTFCGRGFFIKCSLESHVAVKHTKVFSFTCEVCGRGFPQNHALQRHMKIHSGDALTFTCEICSATFIDKHKLRCHQRGHHYQELNLEPYKCSECGKIFATSNGLAQHQVTEHNRDGKFPCTVCNKSFAFSNRLAEHNRRAHTGERPFKCTFCQMTFITNNTLRVHLQLHTEYKFKCKLCPKAFGMKCRLTQHMETKHSQTESICA